jgi:hypothetical protein
MSSAEIDLKQTRIIPFLIEIMHAYTKSLIDGCFGNKLIGRL